jgi:hypothetical protein
MAHAETSNPSNSVEPRKNGRQTQAIGIQTLLRQFSPKTSNIPARIKLNKMGGATFQWNSHGHVVSTHHKFVTTKHVKSHSNIRMPILPRVEHTTWHERA